MGNSSVEYLDKKLTESAKKTLDNYIDNYRVELLLRANNFASIYSDDLNELSANDILRAIEEINSYKKKVRQPFGNKISFMLAVIGALYIILGVALYLYYNIGSYDYIWDQKGLFIALMGGLILVPNYIYIYYRRVSKNQFKSVYKSNSKSVDSLLILAKWQEVEMKVREYTNHFYGESKNSMNTRTLLAKLQENLIITDDDYVTLRNLSKLRNEVVHNVKTNLSSIYVTGVIDAVDIILGKLSLKNNRKRCSFS